MSCQNISQAINFQNLTLKKENFAETSSYMCHLIILIFQFSMFAFSQDYSNNDVFSISSNFLIFYSSKYTAFRPSNPFIRFSTCSLLFFVFFFVWLLLLVSCLFFLLFYLTWFHGSEIFSSFTLYNFFSLQFVLAFTIFFSFFSFLLQKQKSQKFCVLNVFHMQVF